jgi:NAD(P)H-flavin reductase
MEAEVSGRIEEAPGMFTLQLRLSDGAQRERYRFLPGQFNMLYLYGVGEIPISLSSDPEEREVLGHTIRAVGRVTRAISRLEPGTRLGLRVPTGAGGRWRRRRAAIWSS